MADVVAGIDAIGQQALTGIAARPGGDNVEQTLQLQIHNAPIMDVTNARFVAQNLLRAPEGTSTAAAVKDLDLSFLEFTQEAADTFRELFAQTTTLQKVKLEGQIGNENGVLLLSGLHHNRSVTELELSRVGFEGAVGGAIVSTMLRINSRLKILRCLRLPLGVPGARALQPGLRFNQSVRSLCLAGCGLGDEGLSVIVNALGENTTVKLLQIPDNGFTPNGLPHVTQLLQRDSLNVIELNWNCGLFENEENTKVFSSALAETTRLKVLTLRHCSLPEHAK